MNVISDVNFFSVYKKCNGMMKKCNSSQCEGLYSSTDYAIVLVSYMQRNYHFTNRPSTMQRKC